MLYYVSMDLYNFSGVSCDLTVFPKGDENRKEYQGLNVNMCYWDKKEDKLLGYFVGKNVNEARLEALREFEGWLDSRIAGLERVRKNVRYGIEAVWDNMGIKGGRAIIAKKCEVDYLPLVGEYVVWKDKDKWWLGIGEGDRLARDLEFKIEIDEEKAEELERRYEEFVEHSRGKK